MRFNAPETKAVDENRMRGVVLKVDRFGNLITNITPQDVPVLFRSDAARRSRLSWAAARSPKSAMLTPKALREKCLAFSAAWVIWRSPPTAALQRS